MQIIDVPVFDSDGSIKFTQSISPEEAKTLLAFALNFLTSMGIQAQAAMASDEFDD